MKTTTSLAIITIAAIFILLNCGKSGSPVTHTNCDGLITDTVGTNDSGRVYMSDAFTPNGDGHNDICRPFLINISSVEFTIYDGNNNEVYSSTAINSGGWNPGAINNANTEYFYKIQAVTTSNHKIGKCGEVYSLVCFPKGIPQDSLHFLDQLSPNGFTLPAGDPVVQSTCQ